LDDGEILKAGVGAVVGVGKKGLSELRQMNMLKVRIVETK
jgi:hypothetical protein